jgi:hypothetical protein
MDVALSQFLCTAGDLVSGASLPLFWIPGLSQLVTPYSIKVAQVFVP